MSGWLAKTVCGVIMTATLATTGALPTGAAAAKSIAGTYELKTAEERADGQPVCRERWTLRANGSFVIDSGQEKMQGQWHSEDKGREGKWLVWTDQTTNGLPDCRGDVTPQPVADRRTSYYVNGLGGLVITRPTSRLPDGSILWSLVAIAGRVAE